MARLNRDQLLKATELKVVDVDIPELGGVIGVREITLAERSDIERMYTESGKDPQDDPASFRVALLRRTIVNGDSALMFESDEDAKVLFDIKAGIAETMFNAACRLNGYSKSDVEELEKNSAGGRRAASSSGSASRSGRRKKSSKRA